LFPWRTRRSRFTKMGSYASAGRARRRQGARRPRCLHRPPRQPTTWTCRSCDATVYGPALGLDCLVLNGPGVVPLFNRSSSSSSVSVVAPFTRPIGKSDNCAAEEWGRCPPAAGRDSLTLRRRGCGRSVPRAWPTRGLHADRSGLSPIPFS